MKRLLKILFSFIFLFIISITIASCSSDNKWNYSKAEAGKFIELNAHVSNINDSKYTIDLTSTDAIFKNIIDKSNVLLFSLSDLDEVVGYIKYEDVKDHLIDITSISVKNNKEIQIIFDTTKGSEFGILVNKNSLDVDTFAYGMATIFGAKNQVITDYEDQIIKKKGGWDTANKGIQMAAYLTQTVIGIIVDQPGAMAGGIFGLASALGGAFLSSGPSLADVSKQISVIDAKIDAIGNQIDANQKEILEELVRTQAMIDEVKVNQYNQNITAFQTDYVKPLEDYILLYKDSVEQGFRYYVNEGHVVSVYYGKDDVLIKSEDDISSATRMDFTINEFPNSKDYLKNNKDIVDDKFPDAINKDIKVAIKGITLPTGRTADMVTEDIYKTICDEVNQLVLTKVNETLHRDVLQFVSNFVSYAKALAGINFESVINSYTSRLEYIYNFSYETKDIIRDLYASLKLSLDKYLCIANAACVAQKINYTKEIGEAYITAANYIANKYEQEMSTPDNYSYTKKSLIKGDLYNAYCNVSFSNLGNNPNFSASFVLKNKLSFDGNKVDGTTVNVNNINMLDYQSVRAIATRYKVLKSMGITKAKTFINYLADNQIVSNNDLNLMNRVFNGGRTIYRYGRILTSYQIRDLNDSDNVRFRCQCYGNSDGYYFNVGQEYKYRYTDSNVETKYWSGKMAYGDILSCESGELESDKLVSAYARYNESHWYWSDDEHWGFNNGPFGEFFYILAIA